MTLPPDIRGELERLLTAQTAGELTDAEFEHLAALLRQSPEARSVYVAHRMLEAQLEQEHLPPLKLPAEVPSVGVQPSGCEQKANNVRPASKPTRRSAAAIWLRDLTHEYIRQPLALAILVMAMAFGGILAWKFSTLPEPIARNQQGTQAPRSPEGETRKSDSSIARLTATRDATWGDAAWEAGSALHAGQRLSLKQGLAEISFDTGATVILEGPAELELGTQSKIQNPKSKITNSCFLGLGKLFARVPKQAHGFTVDTPDMRIVDLGTEFGVAVKGDPAAQEAAFGNPQLSVTEVQVFRGLVEVEPQIAQAPAEPRTTAPVRLQTGQGVTSVPGGQRPREIQVDESGFVRDLPGSPPTWPRDRVLQPGDIVVATYQGDPKLARLVKIDPKSGRQSVLAREAATPEAWWHSLACLPDGTLLVGTAEPGAAPSRIMKVDPRDGKMSLLATIEKDVAHGNIHGLAVAHDGSIMASVGEHIVRIDATGRRQTTVARVGGGGSRICMDARKRNVLVATMEEPMISLLRGNELTAWVKGAELGKTHAVAVGRDGRVFVASELGSKISVLEIKGGERQSVRAVAELPEIANNTVLSMAAENDGHLIVCSSTPPFNVYRVDVDRGTVETLTNAKELHLSIAVAVVPGDRVEPVKPTKDQGSP